MAGTGQPSWVLRRVLPSVDFSHVQMAHRGHSRRWPDRAAAKCAVPRKHAQVQWLGKSELYLSSTDICRRVLIRQEWISAIQLMALVCENPSQRGGVLAWIEEHGYKPLQARGLTICCPFSRRRCSSCAVQVVLRIEYYPRP